MFSKKLHPHNALTIISFFFVHEFVISMHYVNENLVTIKMVCQG